MRRALLASLTLHGALLALLLMQQGSVAPQPTALTVQLLPATPLAAASVSASPATVPRAKAPTRAPATARAAAATPSGSPATVATTIPQAAVSAAANPALAQVVAAPAAAGGGGQTGSSAAPTREADGHGPPPLPDRAARVVQMPEPDYPPLSRERGEQGVVMLQLAVDASGRLGEVNVLRSSGFARLDKAARAAVLRWRFQPAIENGQPVAAQLTLPVRFALDEN